MTDKIPGAEQLLTETAAVLKALADPNRLRVFDLLMQGTYCNCELKDRLGLASNLLSHHLRVLQQAGLIDSRRDAVDARWIYYSANKEAVDRWRLWFGELLDPARIEDRQVLCGPEGQQAVIDPDLVFIEREAS